MYPVSNHFYIKILFILYTFMQFIKGEIAIEI